MLYFRFLAARPGIVCYINEKLCLAGDKFPREISKNILKTNKNTELEISSIKNHKIFARGKSARTRAVQY